MILSGFVWISWIWECSGGRRFCQPVRRDYTGVVALKKPCNLGTSILMSEPAGMESGSLDGDSALCSRQAWRLAAWMVILQPARDSTWIHVDFMHLGVFWGERVFQPVRRDYTGLDGSRGPKETLQSWNLHSDD